MSPELLLFHCTRPPEGSDPPDGEGELEDIVIPTLVHTIWLMAKRCLSLRWLDSEVPDLAMLVGQLKSNLLLDKAYTERHMEKGTKGCVVSHFTAEEIGNVPPHYMVCH